MYSRLLSIVLKKNKFCNPPWVTFSSHSPQKNDRKQQALFLLYRPQIQTALFVINWLTTLFVDFKTSPRGKKMAFFQRHFSLHCDWANYLNQGAFAFNLLCWVKLWKLLWLPWDIRSLHSIVITHQMSEIEDRSKLQRERESTRKQSELLWCYSIQFKCILLVQSITHIMHGLARGQFLFSDNFKRHI